MTFRRSFLLSMNKPWFIIPIEYFTWKHHFSTLVCVLGYEGQPHAGRGATETIAIPTKDWETSSKASYSCSGSSLWGKGNLISTRLHSSRMRTARLLPVSPRMHRTGGGLVWGVPGPRGGLLPGGVCLGGGGGKRGACLLSQEEVCVSQHAMGQTPPPVNRITDMCKNITLPQLRYGR